MAGSWCISQAITQAVSYKTETFRIGEMIGNKLTYFSPPPHIISILDRSLDIKSLISSFFLQQFLFDFLLAFPSLELFQYLAELSFSGNPIVLFPFKFLVLFPFSVSLFYPLFLYHQAIVIISHLTIINTFCIQPHSIRIAPLLHFVFLSVLFKSSYPLLGFCIYFSWQVSINQFTIYFIHG